RQIFASLDGVYDPVDRCGLGAARSRFEDRSTAHGGDQRQFIAGGSAGILDQALDQSPVGGVRGIGVEGEFEDVEDAVIIIVIEFSPAQTEAVGSGPIFVRIGRAAGDDQLYFIAVNDDGGGRSRNQTGSGDRRLGIGAAGQGSC